MAKETDYDKLCPLFDFANDGGVVFPFRMMTTAAANYIDLDGTAGSTATDIGFFKAVSKLRLVSVQLYACTDGQGFKGAACTQEPILVLRKWTADTSLAAGSLLATITCDLTGDVGTIWTPGAGTTDATLSAGDRLALYLSVAASGNSASTNQDGGVKPVLWFAAVNAP